MAFASVGTIGHSGSKGSNHSTYALMTATNAFEPAPNDRVSCMILAILEHRKLIRNGERTASKDLCAGQWVLSKWHDGWRRDASCAIDPEAKPGGRPRGANAGPICGRRSTPLSICCAVVWDAIWQELHMDLREDMEREASPTAAIIVSPSLKGAEKEAVMTA
jgi:hypothetical protein